MTGRRGRAARTVVGRVALAATGAVTARAVLGALRAAEPTAPHRREAWKKTWERTNFRGERVSLLAGPALSVAVATSAAAGAPGGRLAAASLLAGTAAGAVGGYDDLAASAARHRGDKGFRGHLAALRAGRVSTGVVKVVGIGAAGLLAGRAVTTRPADTVVTAGVVAGTANLVNLLDLRPGRALKAGLLLGVPLLPGRAGGMAAGPVGAATALLGEDLGERVMIGDTGANALGAVLGLRLALAGGPRWRAGVLGVLLALTAASEKVSFTRVIEATPGLRDLDGWGRRPGRPVPVGRPGSVAGGADDPAA